MLYRFHKYLTLFTTGKLINFGNFSCLTKLDIKKLSLKASLWSSYSGTFKKNIRNYNEVNSIRGIRYFGPSQMSLFKLLIHSFSIIAVFKYRVFILSMIILSLLYYLGFLVEFNFLFFQLLIILFNIFIFIVSFRENEKELESSHLDIVNIENLTH
jgi:polyisoprenyl-phosphate glycosyltransferase